jgi:molecular chaperone GrpE
MTSEATKAAGTDPAARSDGVQSPVTEAELPQAPPAAREGHDAAAPPGATTPEPDPSIAAQPATPMSDTDGEPLGDEDRPATAEVDALAARAQKADEYLALAQRTQADFENFRKRAARDAKAAQERGAIRLAQALLPAIDDLDRALAHADQTIQADGENEESGNGAASLVTGLRHVRSGVISALGGVGIESYSPEGERFDPQYHEAVAQQPVDGTEPGVIVEVFQRGYRIGEAVVRPARVVVAG